MEIASFKNKFAGWIFVALFLQISIITVKLLVFLRSVTAVFLPNIKSKTNPTSRLNILLIDSLVQNSFKIVKSREKYTFILDKLSKNILSIHLTEAANKN